MVAPWRSHSSRHRKRPSPLERLSEEKKGSNRCRCTAGSSGLGLFLCRELCERHGATIGYERRALSAAGPEGNEFFVSFADAETRLTQ